MVAYEELHPCKRRAGFEAEPLEPLRVDIAEAEELLTAAGVEVLTNVGMLLVASVGATEISLFESGKVLVKTQDLACAQHASDVVRKIVGL